MKAARSATGGVCLAAGRSSSGAHERPNGEAEGVAEADGRPALFSSSLGDRGCGGEPGGSGGTAFALGSVPNEKSPGAVKLRDREAQAGIFARSASSPSRDSSSRSNLRTFAGGIGGSPSRSSGM